MEKLLRNDYRCILKSRLIPGILLSVFLFLISQTMSQKYLLNVYAESGESAAFKYLACNLIDCYISAFFIMVIPSFVAAFDFEAGMLRNKLIAGYSRTQIYFSNLITSFSLCLLCSLLIFIYKLIVYIGFLTPEVFVSLIRSPGAAEIMLTTILFDILVKFALCSISLAIAMIISNRVISIFVSIALMVSCLLAGISFDIFYEPAGDLLTTIMFMNNIFIVSIAQAEGDIPIQNSAYYVGIIADILVFTSAGLFVFNRRNYK